MKKRIAAMFMATVMVASLTACGKGADKEVAPAETAEAVTETVEAEESAETTEASTEGETAATAQQLSGDLVIYCPHPLEFINPLVSEFENQTVLAAVRCVRWEQSSYH